MREGQIRVAVKGAPFQPGQLVRVMRMCDEEGDRRFVGMCGYVVYLNYDCGCGQAYPNDPMIGVRFPDGRQEEFWRDELAGSREVLPECARRRGASVR